MPYSKYKVLKYPARLEALSKGIAISPIHLEIGLANFCNHDCTFCTYRAQSSDVINAKFDSKHMLRTEDVFRILTESKNCGVEAIQYCGGGEPTLHPDAFHIIEETIKLDLACAMITNGTRITKDNVGSMLGMSWIRISINGGDVATYKQAHNIPAKLAERDFNAAWVAAALCSEVLEGTEVGVSFIATEFNYIHIYQAIERAKEAGVGNIRIGVEVYIDGRPSTLYPFQKEIADQITRGQGLAGDGFSVYSNIDSRIDNSSKNVYIEGEKCYHHWLMGFIGSDGLLYSCPVKKYCSDGVITSVLDKPLKEAYEGEEHIDWSNNNNPCVDCSHGCFLKPKNDLLNGIFNVNRHIEFI